MKKHLTQGQGGTKLGEGIDKKVFDIKKINKGS